MKRINSNKLNIKLLKNGIIISTYFFIFTIISLPLMAAKESAVLKTYADIAEATFEDSLIETKKLHKAVNALVANPTEKNLESAKEAWLAARVPYQQSEAYRFGIAIVDDWEGKVNAWQLDEGLIDYVDSGQYGNESDENSLYVANVIANEEITVNGKTVNAKRITNKSFIKHTS